MRRKQPSAREQRRSDDRERKRLLRLSIKRGIRWELRVRETGERVDVTDQVAAFATKKADQR